MRGELHMREERMRAHLKQHVLFLLGQDKIELLESAMKFVDAERAAPVHVELQEHALQSALALISVPEGAQL